MGLSRVRTVVALPGCRHLQILQLSGCSPLNERDLDVLHLLTQGCRNGEMAVRLHLAEVTAKKHMSSLMRKLNVQDRAQDVLQAKKLGLV
ncbi:MAG: response regulator transcription factor [Caldilineaceae bacterium SB0664_bin_27]|uniref:Response regulator transcription factor n=1 Tax=Caldilineaceae bacterium SB0664_bin_27 TaxID=2605260 RepID=A0A6B0Z1V5_9CHLR|nr:response regulator transcription factor [Caldilineaceae bacterium SB0664_bin_27]